MPGCRPTSARSTSALADRATANKETRVRVDGTDGVMFEPRASIRRRQLMRALPATGPALSASVAGRAPATPSAGRAMRLLTKPGSAPPDRSRTRRPSAVARIRHRTARGIRVAAVGAPVERRWPGSRPADREPPCRSGGRTVPDRRRVMVLFLRHRSALLALPPVPTDRSGGGSADRNEVRWINMTSRSSGRAAARSAP